MSTILITGASSGIGNETAKLFQAKNWNVAATMRHPEEAIDLKNIADVKCFALDVTKPDTIRKAIEDATTVFGGIDVVVNNAGYGAIGPFETATDEQVREQFETNVFGTMNVCREMIPYFRERKKGTIINIASIGGRMSFPYFSLYNSTKWAVEGFSESLQYELQPFNIRVKLIEPGPIKTDFYSRSQVRTDEGGPSPYDHAFAKALAKMSEQGESAPGPEIVAAKIYDAATDTSNRLRYGVNTKGILAMKRLLPESWFRTAIKTALLR